MLQLATPSAELGGAARALEWACLPSLVQGGQDLPAGGWMRDAVARYGVQSGSSAMLTTMFENGGAGGGAGNGGKGWIYHKGHRTLSMGIRQTAGAASAPNDQYCKGHPTILIERPVGSWVFPLQAWDIIVVMARRTVPAAAITEDLGIVVEADTAIAGYPGDFRANIGNNQAGFVVSYDGAAGELRWYSRKVFAGAALTESLPLGVNPGTDFVKVVLRLTGATPSSDASVRVIINDAVVLTRNWGAGTVLVNRTDAPTWGGSFRVFIRNSDSGAGGACPLSVAYWAIRAADTAALLTA